MKLRILIFGLLFSAVAPMWAQGGVDVTTLMADTKTFIFSDNQSTVKGYIYEQMEAQSSCCGKDRIYLEVKIDPSGYVLSAKTLTGRNDCFMQSAIDIVKNIKWNTEDFKGGPRSVYFEIKPDISCDGGRANEYAAIEVFNNELLNGTAAPTSAPVATAPAPQSQPTTPPVSTPAATPPASTPPAATTTTPASEPVAVTTPAATEPEVTEVVEEPAATEVEEAAPIASATPPAPVAEDEPVVVESIEAKTETPSSPPGTIQRPQEPIASTVNPTDPPRGVNPAAQRELTEEEKAAIANQDAERQRRAEEIRQLKEEMGRMRESEERERESQRMAAAQQQTQPDPYAYNNDNGGSSDYDENEPFTGGIPGLKYDGDEALPYEDGNSGQSDQVDPAASQEDRIRNDISSIEQKIRDLENKNRDAENAIRQQMQETDRANREIVQLHEEKIRREEEAAELRDQNELNRIEEDRRRIEQDREKQTAEIQRLQDELARLQSDVQVKMSDLDRQQEDIDRITMQKQQREQEIQLERALRAKEQEAELERIRLGTMNGSNLASGGINASDMPVDFATAADSEKYVFLVQQVNMLTQEVNELRTQLGKAPLPQPQTPPTGGGATEGARVAPSPGGSPGSKSAANDRSWEELDFVAPDLTEEDYQIVAKPQPVVTAPQGARTSEPGTPVMDNPAAEPARQNPADANYRPGRGYSSLSENHGNTAGPELRARSYVNGETALKELVKDNLRAGGVCGMAQVLFSVTLKPDGTVVSYRVLAANTPQVQAQIGTLIPNLKFDSVDARYNQTIYQEIKAEIFCEVEEPANP